MALSDQSAITDRLNKEFQQKFTTLRNVRTQCHGAECEIVITSKGLTDPSERGDIYNIIANEPSGIFAGSNYRVRKRETALFGDDTAIVKLIVSEDNAPTGRTP